MIALKTKRRKTKHKSRASPRLRFSPYAWAKLVFSRDIGETEVGGFGISSKDDLLLIEDFGGCRLLGFEMGYKSKLH